MTTKKIIFAIILLGILSLIYVWFFVYNKSHADFQTMKPIFSGDAVALYDQIDDQIDDQFEERYRNQAVELKGVVVSVEGRSAILNPGVQIRIHDDRGVPGWSVGDELAVKCRFVGMEEDMLSGEMILLCDQCVPQ